MDPLFTLLSTISRRGHSIRLSQLPRNTIRCAISSQQSNEAGILCFGHSLLLANNVIGVLGECLEIQKLVDMKLKAFDRPKSRSRCTTPVSSQKQSIAVLSAHLQHSNVNTSQSNETTLQRQFGDIQSSQDVTHDQPMYKIPPSFFLLVRRLSVRTNGQDYENFLNFGGKEPLVANRRAIVWVVNQLHRLGILHLSIQCFRVSCVFVMFFGLFLLLLY